MKNLKIYKSALAILTSASILLLSGSSDAWNKEKRKLDNCKHLTIYFANKKVVFKECEGYDINIVEASNYIEFKILITEENVLYGETKIENLHYFNHNREEKKQKTLLKTK